ncbi:MAG: hypothetical protein M1814_002099 [Vezdaea aestivalis]|nr:MAG: hypothetical protein M1814_002099 [Vezdaea aestivalis]
MAGHSSRSETPQTRDSSVEPCTPEKRLRTTLTGALYDQPRVWADTKPDLAESFSHFRNYQSWVYTAKDHPKQPSFVKGVLLANVPNPRQIITSICVVGQAGGNKENVDGVMAQARDKSANSADVKSFLRTRDSQLPIAIIVDERCPLINAKLAHSFSVLDWFKITHCWWEAVDEKKVFKIRFEKLDRTRMSWWDPYQNSPPSENLPALTMATCGTCQVESFQVYENGWICLNKDCSDFWTLLDGAPPIAMDFCHSFLNAYTPWPNETEPHDIRQSAPLQPIPEGAGPLHALSRLGWMGMICPDCGRCCPQEKFFKWSCSSCKFKHEATHPIVTIGSLVTTKRIKNFFLSPSVTSRVWSAAEARRQGLTGYKVNDYTITGIGNVFHIQSTVAINKKRGGADSLFHQLQSDDSNLNPQVKRNKLAQAVVQGTYTRHAAMNYGMPYKYSVQNGNKSFEEAPQTILQSLAMLRSKAVATGSTDCNFNELLAVGYLETQSMSYHDDGETGLAPTIATLSLGGSAKMDFRMKHRYYFGRTATANSKYSPDVDVVSGCVLEAERTHYKGLVEAGTMNKAEFNAAIKAASTATTPTGRRSGKKHPSVLTMELKHGDYVVMCGADIQRYYEHSVESYSSLRFALTSRTIDPATVAEDERGWGTLPQ